MAKKKAAQGGAQKELPGAESQTLGPKLTAQLEADRDACKAKSDSDASAKVARESLIEQMKADGLTRIRCPFRDRIITVVEVPKVKIEAIKSSEDAR